MKKKYAIVRHQPDEDEVIEFCKKQEVAFSKIEYPNKYLKARKMPLFWIEEWLDTGERRQIFS